MSNRTSTRSRTVSAAIAVLVGAVILGACAANGSAGAPEGGESQSGPSAPTDSGSTDSGSTGSGNTDSGNTGSANTGSGSGSEPAGPTGSGTSAPEVPVPVPQSLLGSVFSSKSATGRNLVTGKPLTLTFSTPDQVGLHAGCNGMGGTPQFDGTSFKVDQIISTMMACTEDGVMDQERWFSTWLTAGVSWKLDGANLILSSDEVTVTFARSGPVPSQSSGPAGATSQTASPIAPSHPSIPSAHPPITAPTGTILPGSTPAATGPAVKPVTPISSTPPARPRLGGNSVAPPPSTPNK